MKFVVNIKESEYTKFVSKHKKSHFLQSYEWGELSKTRGLTPYYVGLKNDKNKLVATALLLEKKLPLNYTYFYIPRGFILDYNDSELIKIFTEKINEFTKKKKSIFFKIDPDIKLHNIDEDANVVDGENNYKLVKYFESIGYKRRPLTKYFETMQPRYTFRIDLTKEIDEIIKSYSSTARNAMKRADNYGVKIIEGNKDNVKDFVRLMKMTEKRQNFYSHNEQFYYDFYDMFAKNNNLKVLLAEINFKDILKTIEEKINNIKNKKKVDTDHLNKLNKEFEFFLEKSKVKSSEIVSAYFMVYYGNKSWYLYGANDMEYKDAFANYKIFDYQVKKAKEENIEIFDEFGTIGDPKSTRSVIGIHNFKKKFGGEYTEFIGEFNYVQDYLMYFIYMKLIPLRHKIINKRLKKKGE